MKGSFHENVMSLRVQEKAEFLLQSCIKFTLITLCNVCSVHRRGGGGGRRSVHRRETFSASEDTMSTSRGYHDACGGAS